jgi:hypothetical protein
MKVGSELQGSQDHSTARKPRPVKLSAQCISAESRTVKLSRFTIGDTKSGNGQAFGTLHENMLAENILRKFSTWPP